MSTFPKVHFKILLLFELSIIYEYMITMKFTNIIILLTWPSPIPQWALCFEL
jgi:hypothetical protein